MQIKWRALASMVLAITVVGLLATWALWQPHRHSMAVLHQSWQSQLDRAWQQQSAQSLQQLEMQASGLAHTDHGRAMKDVALGTPSFSGDLDSPTNPSHLHLLDHSLPIPAQLLQSWLTEHRAASEPLRGLMATAPQHLDWVHFSQQGSQWRLTLRPLQPTLQTLQQHLGGALTVQSPWQPPPACGGQLPFSGTADCLHSTATITRALHDLQGQHIAQLMWAPQGYALQWAEMQQQWQRTVWILLAAGGVLAMVLALLLHVHMRPLDRGIATLQRLVGGDVHADIEEAHWEDEAGNAPLYQALHAIRLELVQLETLRQERQRLRLQHERLIRNELRKLADSLDSASRDEILQSLAQQPSPSEPSTSENTLAELAGVLGRMSGLVSTQQNRLLKLLKELQASMHTQAMLASLQQELEIARQMQLSILPRSTPDTQLVHIDALMLPAKEVGGDFYDYFLIDEDHLAVVVADVSGKGVPAAFFMAISRTLLKSHAMHLVSASDTIGQLNDQLCAENDQMMFVTVFYAVLQLSTGTMHYVNAGHNPPLLQQPGHTSYLQSAKNMALAVLEDQVFTAGTITLAPGDQIIFYTDGVTEATDTSSSLFGEARLLQAVNAHGTEAGALPGYLLDQVRRFENGAPQADDITIVSLRYMGPSSADSTSAVNPSWQA